MLSPPQPCGGRSSRAHLSSPWHCLYGPLPATAVEIFELNAEAFPQSFNAYDSLAEACMVNGDTTRVVVNYERSLELNPDHTTAVAQLRLLGRPWRGAGSDVSH